MLGALGCRIGELLASDWTKIDLQEGTIAIEGAMIREKGVGLFVQPHTKSDAGMRTIYIPSWAVKLLTRGHYVILTTPGQTSGTPSPGHHGQGCIRMPSVTWWRLGWTTPGCPLGRSPTTSGTRR